MADSNITKKALADSLKELIVKTPFEKISIAQICDGCGMKRQSFYYHFKDKYDLVNWIFDTEFIALVKRNGDSTGWDMLVALCLYLDENRTFYRRALQIEGQNSFSDHFTEMLQVFAADQLRAIFGDGIREFHVRFITDAMIAAIRRWILEHDEMDAGEFLKQMRFIQDLPKLSSLHPETEHRSQGGV